MAKQLSKTGITRNNTIEAWHITQSIDALTGIDAYDITISGSLEVTGSVNITPTQASTGTNVLTVDSVGKIYKTGSYGGGGGGGSSLWYDGTTYLSSSLPIKVDSDITASGNISSSGNITADEITCKEYHIVADNHTEFTISGSNASSTFNLTNENSSGAIVINTAGVGSIFFGTNGNTNEYRMYPGGHLWLTGAAGPQNIWLTGDVSASGDLYGDNLIVGTDITASGDISASAGIVLGGVRKTSWPAGGTGLWYDGGTYLSSSKDVQITGSFTQVSGSFLWQQISPTSSVDTFTLRGYAYSSGSGGEESGTFISQSFDLFKVTSSFSTENGIHWMPNLNINGPINYTPDAGDQRLVVNFGTASYGATSNPNVYFRGSNYIRGHASISGSEGKITISSLIPAKADEGSVGTLSKRYDKGYINNLTSTNITASGNISASGDLSIQGTSDFDGAVDIHGGASTLPLNITANSWSHIINTAGSTSGASYQLRATNSAAELSLFFSEAGSGNSRGWIKNVSGVTKIEQNASVGGALNTRLELDGPNDNINITASTFTVTGSSTMDGDLSVSGHITASGNISSSGYVSASSFIGDGSQLTNLPSDPISNASPTLGEYVPDSTQGNTTFVFNSIASFTFNLPRETGWTSDYYPIGTRFKVMNIGAGTTTITNQHASVIFYRSGSAASTDFDIGQYEVTNMEKIAGTTFPTWICYP